jgi:hypothetical protein
MQYDLWRVVLLLSGTAKGDTHTQQAQCGSWQQQQHMYAMHEHTAMCCLWPVNSIHCWCVGRCCSSSSSKLWTGAGRDTKRKAPQQQVLGEWGCRQWATQGGCMVWPRQAGSAHAPRGMFVQHSPCGGGPGEPWWCGCLVQRNAVGRQRQGSQLLGATCRWEPAACTVSSTISPLYGPSAVLHLQLCPCYLSLVAGGEAVDSPRCFLAVLPTSASDTCGNRVQSALQWSAAPGSAIVQWLLADCHPCLHAIA